MTNKLKSFQILTNLNCNLDCEYCYERKNSWVAKAEDVIAFLDAGMAEGLEGVAEIQIDFIGGESLMYSELLDEVMQHALKYQGEYGVRVRFSLCTNGTLINSMDVERLLLKYRPVLGVAVSIDGPDWLHNRHRKFKATGEGSYGRIVRNLPFLFRFFPNLNVKATFTRETVGHYDEAIIHLIELGFNEIAGNLVFEDPCDFELGAVLSQKFTNIIDYIFEHGLEKTVKVLQVTGFEDLDFLKLYMRAPDQLERNYCGTAKEMRCLGKDNKVYGCNRFCTMNKLNMEIGEMVDGKVVKTNPEHEASILSYYERIESECGDCRLRVTCSSCVAAAYEADDVDAYTAEKRMCGWTYATAIARLYFQARMDAKTNSQVEAAA